METSHVCSFVYVYIYIYVHVWKGPSPWFIPAASAVWATSHNDKSEEPHDVSAVGADDVEACSCFAFLRKV